MDKFEEFIKQLNIATEEEAHQMYFACGYLMATRAVETFVKMGAELGHIHPAVATLFSKFLDRVFFDDNQFVFVTESYNRFHEGKAIREAEELANGDSKKEDDK